MTQTPKKTRRISLRTQFLALTMMPPILIGAVWISNDIVSRQAHEERVQFNSLRVVASNFNDRIRDVEAYRGADLDSGAVQKSVDVRARDLISSTGNILHIAVIGNEGNTALGMDASDVSRPGAQWSQANPGLAQTANALGRRLLKPETRFNAINDQISYVSSGERMTVIGMPRRDGLGATVLFVDTGSIEEVVQEQFKASLVPLLVGLIFVLLVSSVFVTNLNNRMRRLQLALEGVVNETTDEIPVEGNDEITDIARSVESLKDSYDMLKASRRA